MRTIMASAAAFVLAWGPIAPLNGQEIPIDDFEGEPPLGGWTLIDNTTGTPWESGAFDVIEETGGNHVLRMHFAGSELQPPGTPLTPLVAIWNDSFVNPIYSAGYLRAEVKIDEPNAVGCLARGDLAGGNGYTLCMVALDENISDPKAGHQFHIDRFENGVDSLQWLSGRDDNIEFELGDWWNVELGVVGATISARVWEVGTPEPVEPQFVWSDPFPFPGGQIALYSLVQSQLMPVESRADASFDNVRFLVPEPAAVYLLVTALIGMATFRRV